ncbi:trigger factor [Aeromonas bivalvium]|uniref:trigger factor n=1 Tax=Aeromonas bivalvium TaxID=440079 RepID=UPI000DCFA679|nr:trigger factor [Aeromonas bivalvium]
MQVSVETTQGLERRLTITVPAATVDAAVRKELNGLAKTRRIDGFRPGKAPVAIIKKMFGAMAHARVADDMMQSNFIKAIIENKLSPAGAPTMDPKEIKEGQDFEFTATFEVYPEFEVAGLESIKVEKPIASVKDEDLANMIDTLRKQHATWSESDTAAAAGMRVTMDFVGSIDGEEFDGGKAEGFTLELGAGRMIPGFEDAILGKKAGDEFTIEVTFPADYHAENLKGKAAKFASKLNKVEVQVLPELTEEFVKRFGIESGNVEDLKAEVRKNMERELAQALKNSVKEQVLNGLVEANQIDLPKAAVEQEIDTLRQQALQRFGGFQGGNAAELFQAQAERRVRVGLLLGDVIRTNEIKADDARVTALIESMATAYEDPKEVIEYYQKNEQMLNGVRNLAVEDQAIDLILSKAQVTEKEVAFDDVINKSGAAA